MPAKSKNQQMAAGAALAAKRGKGKQQLKGASKDMYESMSEKELRELVKTSRKGKPKKVSKK